MGVNISEIIKSQKRQRYKSIIITRNIEYIGKEIIEKLFNNINEDYEYIDIIKEFSENKDLRSRINSFDINELQNYLKEIKSDKEIIIIDNLEMIFSMYEDFEIEKFLEMFKLDKIKKYGTDYIYIFMLPNLQILKNYDIRNQDDGLKRIISILDIKL